MKGMSRKTSKRRNDIIKARQYDQFTYLQGHQKKLSQSRRNGMGRNFTSAESQREKKKKKI